MTPDFARRLGVIHEQLDRLYGDLYRSNDHAAANAVKRARRELEHPSAGDWSDVGALVVDPAAAPRKTGLVDLDAVTRKGDK